MRFTTPVQKAVVIVVLLAVNGILILLLDAFHSEAGSIALTVLQTAGWYLATRLFRGPGERVRAARPWWRMTNRPLLSGVLAAIYLLFAVVNLVLTAAGFGSASGFASIVAEALLGGLFAVSYRRLSAQRRALA
jgi:hypothetical protein